MKDRREINIEVFEDTTKHYKSNPTLKAAVSNSVAKQKFTAADETVELPQCAGGCAEDVKSYCAKYEQSVGERQSR